jgi:AraC-like DNA-binding protein
MQDYWRIWDAIRTVSCDPNIGLRLALAHEPTNTEPLFLALWSAADLQSALEILCRYKRMLSPDGMSLDIDREVVKLTWTLPDVNRIPPQALIDAEFCFIVTLFRKATGKPNLRPLRVGIPSRELDPGSHHQHWFKCDIQLGTTEPIIEFSSKDAALPFLTHNAHMLEALQPYLQANTPSHSDPLLERIKLALGRHMRGKRATLQGIGRELAMSSRSLQRALYDRNTSFRELVDEVRNATARDFLDHSDLSCQEIAFLTGFSDSNSFSRAFRSWNAISPSEYRNNRSRPQPGSELK